MTCSKTARELNEPLIGTAPLYPHYICIEDKQSLWKRGISGAAGKKHHYTRYEHLDAFFSLINGVCNKFVRPLLIDQDRDHNDHTIFIYSLHQGKYICHRYTVDSLNSILPLFAHYVCHKAKNVPQQLQGLLEAIANKVEDDQYVCEQDTNARVFVCNHNYYDRCCSRGKVIHDEIRKHNFDSWRCSHIGGHRFAATLMSMPDGRYYGKIETADIKNLLNSIVMNKPFLGNNQYRGLGTASPQLQYVEYLAWTEQVLPQKTIKSVWVKDDVTQIYIKRTYTCATTEYFAVTLEQKTSDQVRYASCSGKDAQLSEKQKPWKYFTIDTFQKITANE